ncbi:MAG TPA: hypothetical protein VF066_08410 [Thermoleophilaceae bacterium]
MSRAMTELSLGGHRGAGVTSRSMPVEKLGVGRVCPHCEVRSDTLGSVCPACGTPYAGRGLLEWVRWWMPIVAAALVVAWVWLVIANPVAGIIVAGAAFVLLVAAIGVTNALADRSR